MILSGWGIIVALLLIFTGWACWQMGREYGEFHGVRKGYEAARRTYETEGTHKETE